MRYSAFAYKQNEHAPIQVCLIAPSCDIDSWARVPVRLSGRPHGFQRAEVPRHVAEIKQFFDADDTKTNSSPTAVLIGVSPEAADKITLHDTSTGDPIAPSQVGATPIQVEVQMNFDSWDPSAYDSLDAEIAALYAELRAGILAPEELNEDSGDTEYMDADGAVATGDDDSEDFESEDDDADATASDNTGGSDDEETFFLDLTAQDIAQLCEAQAYTAWSDNRKERLAEMLRDERKPCLIIDGQHRISATKDLGVVPFLVSLLPTASWAELAFQFIVNNSSAKKVDDNLLFAIVGQSLEADQLRSIEARLNRSGIKVSLIKASMRVQLEENPFAGMLKTNTPGDPGFLDATAMQKKVITLWFGSRGRNGLTPALRKFRAITDDPGKSREFSMADLFLANCKGSSRLERAEDWQTGRWFEYFSAFWSAIRGKYETDGIWPRSNDAWPPPRISGSLSADQRRVQNLMGATILGMLQVAVLQRWAERRVDRLDPGEQLPTKPIDPEVFEHEIGALLESLSADFFLSYKRSGPDASKEVRQQFIRAAMAVLRGEKSVAEVKSGNDYFRND